MAIDINNQGATFSITVIKLLVSVVTLSTQDNAKLPEQLKSGFKRSLNGVNINQSKRKNQYLDYLIDSSFQGVNSLFLLWF